MRLPIDNNLMRLFTIESHAWDDVQPASVTDAATDALEGGGIVYFPNLRFELTTPELTFLDPASVHGAKNVSFNPATGKVGGTQVQGTALEQLRGLLDRFARTTGALLRHVLPSYRSALEHGRSSLRPVEIAGRASSWRADDTRLHVDAFPSMPMRGKRILRVFSNINPSGQPRTWKVGGSFDQVARRFRPSLHAPVPGSHLGMYLVRMTKEVRTPYDHYMLQLHDRMKVRRLSGAARSRHPQLPRGQHLDGLHRPGSARGAIRDPSARADVLRPGLVAPQRTVGAAARARAPDWTEARVIGCCR